MMKKMKIPLKILIMEKSKIKMGIKNQKRKWTT
jgi:hypothetical protein